MVHNHLGATGVTMNRVLAAGFAALVLGGWTPDRAPTCRQSDLKGLWQINLKSYGTTCKALINRNGYVVQSACFEHGKHAGRLGGRIEFAKGCKLTGRIVVEVPGVSILTGMSGRLHPNKGTMSGFIRHRDSRIAFAAKRKE